MSRRLHLWRKAAVMADEYVLTHKNIFVTRAHQNVRAMPNKTLVFSNTQKSETRTKLFQKAQREVRRENVLVSIVLNLTIL